MSDTLEMQNDSTAAIDAHAKLSGMNALERASLLLKEGNLAQAARFARLAVVLFEQENAEGMTVA